MTTHRPQLPCAVEDCGAEADHLVMLNAGQRSAQEEWACGDHLADVVDRLSIAAEQANSEPDHPAEVDGTTPQWSVSVQERTPDSAELQMQGRPSPEVPAVGRSYLGDYANGNPRVRFIEAPQRPEVSEINEILDEAAELYRSRPALGPPDAAYLARRERFMDRKHDLINRIEASEREPKPVPLRHQVCDGACSGFTWGDSGSGSSDLARSLLTAELGELPPPSVYTKFAADVVARLPRDGFELPATKVMGWVAENRSLVEAELFLEDRSSTWAVDKHRPAQAVQPESQEAPDLPSVTTNVVSSPAASQVVRACEEAWAAIQERHPEVPDAVVVLGTGVERGRLVKLGHWWGGQWLADGKARGELLLAGEALHLPPEQVFEVLLHEAAHGLNATRGVRDTSRGGRYHNARFQAAAEEVGLTAGQMRPHGWARTTLRPETVERYTDAVTGLGEAMRIARQLEAGVRLGAEEGAGAGRDDAENGTGAGRGRTGGTRVGARCGCGRRLLMAPSVLAAGPVLCGMCGVEFTASKSAERSAGSSATANAVIDRSFLERRQKALEVQGSSPSALDLHPSVMSEGQLARVDAILEQHRVAGRALTGRELAAWQQRWSTDEERLLVGASAADVAQLNDVARELLAATGSLRGPGAVVDGKEFLAGDRVVVGPGGLRPPTTGEPELPQGIVGLVERVAADGTWLDVDFAVDGRARLSTAELDESSLDYAYAVSEEELVGDLDLRSIHLAPVLEAGVAPPPTVELDI
ncbi:MAG TPA: DUF6166 domain-containing protein [Acidimicrobiales bacterium]|nr:DUF6166 domain-containing protein [Acidimicrobiales bacterium]